MIKYTLPDFTNGLSLNLFFIRLLQEQPECFLDEVQIESIYGCFPSCILNGGRSFIRERYTASQIEQTYALLEEHGIITRLTFTNMLAEPQHLEDEYVAQILSLAQRYSVEAIVYSDALANRLKQDFGIKCVLSTTRGIDNPHEFNELAKKYDYLVLNYNMNKDRSFIERIENRSKVEIMVNEYCRLNCPHREAHYLQNSEDQMNGVARPFPCDHQDGGAFFEHRADHPVYLTTDEVAQLNEEFGIEYFKIVGRGITFETVLESYVYFLVKPEYRDRVKQLVRHSSR